MRRGIIGLLGFIAAAIGLGTYGMMRYEGTSLFDSFYFVLVTLTTVGYGDITPSTHEGRIVAILLLLLGVGAVMTVIPLAFSYFVERGIRSALGLGEVQKMADHIILCYYNAFTDQAIDEITAHGIPFIVVERDEEATAKLKDLELPHIHGDPAEERTLRNAFIEEARTLILASRRDSENVFTAIAARNLNPDIQIIARVNSEDTIPILRRVGVETIIDPQEITSVSLVNSVLSSYSAELLDRTYLFKDIRLGQFQVTSDSPVAGKTLKETRFRDVTGAPVVAAWLKDRMVPNPPGETRLEENSVLFLMGTDEELKKAKALVVGPVGGGDKG